MTALRLAGSTFIVLALTTVAAARQAGPDGTLEIVTKLARQAMSEVLEAEKADEDSDALEDLGRRWAAKLWEFHARPGDAKAGAAAAAAALHVLVHAGLLDEAIGRARTLDPDDAAWARAIPHLFEGAQRTRDFAPLIALLDERAPRIADPEARLSATYHLARAHQEQGETDRAVELFDQVAADGPDSRWGTRARRDLLELRDLQAGQPAPAFSVATMTGERISTESLRGRAVLLNFWSPT